VNDLKRRLAAVVAVMALVALVAGDLWVGTLRSWWDRHSLTASVITNLLVLAVTALIIDEVVARRQRRQRAVSVAVQALIVYGQARRAYVALTTTVDDNAGTATEEMRALASMVLTASSSLFDDPVARAFLAQTERMAGVMFRTSSATSAAGPGTKERDRLASEMSRLKAAVTPLLGRIPAEERSILEGPSET